jgi:hypothetical protein
MSESRIDTASDVAHIEELMRDLPGETGTPEALLRERLEAARFYLLGCMHDEYRFNLGLVKNILPDLQDEVLRDRVTDFLRSQEPDAPV